MPREIGGPNPEEMGITAGREFKNPENQKFVQDTLTMAEQLKGNKVRPELVEALDKAFSLGDPGVLEALDPTSARNQKFLSAQQKENLERAWQIYNNTR